MTIALSTIGASVCVRLRRSAGLLGAGALAATAVVPAGAAAAGPADGALARTPAPRGVAPLVCVVDGGVRPTGALASALVASEILPGVAGGVGEADDHGTFVAEAVVATWPWARIASVRIVEGGTADGGLVPGAIDRCVALGASVVNISLVGAQPQWLRERTREAMERARAADVDVVVAAGNDGGPVSFPGDAAPDVAIAVDATDGTSRCSFSSTGPEVVVGALGCPMLLPLPGGAGSSAVSGSSFAAPQVAAALAAIRAYAPGSTPASRRAVLSGMPNGTLDQAELLRRIGRADLMVPSPVAAATPAPTATAKPTSAATAATAAPTARARPRIRVAWRSRRLTLVLVGAPTAAKVLVRRAGAGTVRAAPEHGRWTVPSRVTRAAGRLTVLVEGPGDVRLASRTVRIRR